MTQPTPNQLIDAMKTTLFLALLVVTAVTLFRVTAEEKTERAPVATPAPVDDDMHHLMEYVFEPAWKRLQVTMASEPSDKTAWKAMKEDALTLAEVSNLLLHRAPDEKAGDWKRLAVETRSAGADFYQAARKRDFPAATESYRVMLKSCNACHDTFADGERQLAPLAK